MPILTIQVNAFVLPIEPVSLETSKQLLGHLNAVPKLMNVCFSDSSKVKLFNMHRR
ncbi:MAG: hypothetical protein ACEY3J_02725 [Arsenophonus sp.]